MVTENTKHDTKRDRMASSWRQIPPFTCAACKTVTRPFPKVSSVKTEARYSGRLRADVGAFDDMGKLVGVVEIVDSHPPTTQALYAQELLGFAHYFPLQCKPPVWLCSPDCWAWYIQLAGKETVSPWEAPRCEGCSGFFYQNSLSCFEFRDWSDDPNAAYCIHCAAGHAQAQWRDPGELAGGDPREWTPDDDSALVTPLFMAYSDAEFWSMVWSQRVARIEAPDAYDGAKQEAAEDGTAKRLPLVMAAFNSGEWARGADLLLPVGAPGWAAYPGETERMLAFRSNNCIGTAEAWRRLLTHRLEQLPEEVANVIRQRWGQCCQCYELIPKTEPQYPTCLSCDAPRRDAEITRRKAVQLERSEQQQHIDQERREQQQLNQQRELAEFQEWFGRNRIA